MIKSGNVVPLFFLGLFVILQGLACRRDNTRTIIITGHAIDAGTQMPVYHASVGMKLAYKGEKLVYGPVPADSTGFFSLVCEDVLIDASGSVEVYDTHSNVPYRFGLLMQDQETITFNPRVGNPAVLRYVFINAAPYDINDSVSDFYIERPWGRQEVFPRGSITTATTSSNSYREGSYYGCPETILHYTVTKNGISVSLTDTFHVTYVYANWRYKDTIWY